MGIGVQTLVRRIPLLANPVIGKSNRLRVLFPLTRLCGLAVHFDLNDRTLILFHRDNSNPPALIAGEPN
jgi:hypothetical protein